MTKNYFKLIVLACFVAFMAIQPIAAARIYLYPSGASNPWGTRPDGTVTQANADLSQTLNTVVSGNEVWMAAGDYTTNATITLLANVTIYGGFFGNETSTALGTPPTGRPLLDADNGVTEPWEFQYPTTIRGNGFTGTSVTYAIFNGTNLFTLNGVTIDGLNTSNSKGGGIYAKARLIITNCIFRNINHTGGTGGAGIYSDVAGGPTITSCLFENCVTVQAGGAIYSNQKITVNQCVIRNNFGAAKAAAIFLQGSADNGNTTTINNNAIYNNASTGQGGAIQIYSSASDANVGPLNMINNTFVNNIGVGGGYSGAVSNFHTTNTVAFKYYNNVFYNNMIGTTVSNMTFTSPAGGTIDIQNTAYNGGLNQGATTLVTSTGAISTLTTPNFVNPSTTIGYSYPMPADVKAANFAILGTSPLLNAGNTFTGVSIPTTDINGNVRPGGTAYDIGAYECLISLSVSSLTGLSAEKSFTVSGTNLTGNVTINPPAHYQISLTSGSGYQSTPISLTQTGGILASTPIYVLVNGTPTTVENIVVSSTGISSQNIACYSQSTTQTITFPALTAKTYGDADFAPAASASSGLTVSYSSSNIAVATIVSNQIHIVGVGNTTIVASQAGNVSYPAAASVSQSLTVNKKPLNITGLTVSTTKVYDGTTTTTVSGTAAIPTSETKGTGTSTDGLPYTGDVVTISGTATGAYNSKDVTATKITYAGLTLAGAQVANYSINTVTATITKKPLTMTGLSVATSKVYDGLLTTPVTGTPALLTAEVYGAGNTSDGMPYTIDVVSISGTAVGTYNSKDVATASTVTFSGLSLAGAQAGNYSLTVQSPASAVITIASLTLTGAAGVNKAYDGTNAATITGTLTGILGTDVVTLIGTGTFADINIGTGISITSTATLGGAQAGDYALTQPTGLTASIFRGTSTWTGTGNWSTGGANWTLVPLSANDVVVASGELTIDQTQTIHSITVNPGAKLTLNDGVTLNAGTFTLLSDATGTGTFVDKNSATTPPAITANVQQYLTGGRNWYVSSPVAAATTAALSSATSVVSYDEPTGNWITETGTLTPLKGYISIDTKTDGAVTFTGTLNSGNQSITLSSTGGSFKGFNLVGNPYPSYIDWNKVYTASSDIDPTMWYRTKLGAVYEFDTYNAIAGVGTNNGITVTQYIPPMQAYWVVVTTGNPSGSIQMDNTMRSHDASGTNLLKAKSEFNTAQQVVRLQVSNGTNSDEAIVLFNQNATNGYDLYDSPKITNDETAIPELYTLAGNEKVVINGMNSITPADELPLGFTTGESNTFTIKATEISNFDADTKVILKDNLLATQQELTIGSPYTFTSDATSTASRFSLIFKSTTGPTGIREGNDDQPVYVYKNGNNQITVQCSVGLNSRGSVTVTNAIGQKLITKQITGSITVIDNQLGSGVYLVTVTNAGKSITQKVILN